MKYFKLYFDWSEKTHTLSDAELGRLITAIMAYATNGELVELTGAERHVFPTFKSQIDKDNVISDKRAKAGATGGVAKPSKSKQTQANASKNKQTQAKVSKIFKEKEKKENNEKEERTKEEKEIKEIKEKEIYIYSPTASEIINYLNEKAGTNFKAKNQLANRKITARLNEGYTVDEFKTVIDNKCEEWLETDMAKYLRPETLFGSKFDSYLNQPTQTQYDDRKHFVFNKGLPRKRENPDEKYRAFFESAFKP